MAIKRELTDFERGMLVSARRIRHFISEIATGLNIPRSTVPGVYFEYLNSTIASHHGQRSGRFSALNDRNQRRLRRIVSENKQTALR